MNFSVAFNVSESPETCIAPGFSGGDVQITAGARAGLIFSSCLNAFGILVGVPGNILVILAISVNQSLRHNSDLVLLVLAVCDLLVSALLQPSFLARKIEYLALKRARCATVEAAQVLYAIAGTGSMVSQMLVSLERTVAVLAPYWYEDWVTPAALFAPTVCVWFVLSLVLGAVWGSSFKAAHIVAATLNIICLLVTLVCSVILVKVANRHEDEIVSQQQQVQLSEEERKKIKRERKALWTAIYVNTTFFVCYIPGIVAAFLTATIIPSSEDQKALFSMIVGTGFIGFASAVNPIILYRRNAHIGREIRKLVAIFGHHRGTAPKPAAQPPPEQT